MLLQGSVLFGFYEGFGDSNFWIVYWNAALYVLKSKIDIKIFDIKIKWTRIANAMGRDFKKIILILYGLILHGACSILRYKIACKL